MNIKEFGNLANKSVAFSGRFKLKNLRILVAAHCRQVIQHPSFFHKADLLVEGKRVNQKVRQLLENGHPSVDEAGILSLAGLLDTSRDRIEPLPQCFQRYACALALNMTHCSPYHSFKVPQLDLSYFTPPLYDGSNLPWAPHGSSFSSFDLRQQDNNENESTNLSIEDGFEVDGKEVEEILWNDSPLGQEIDEFVGRQMRAQNAI